jgi:hypothetical protein
MQILYNNVNTQKNTGVKCMFNISLPLNDIDFKTLEKEIYQRVFKFVPVEEKDKYGNFKIDQIVEIPRAN